VKGPSKRADPAPAFVQLAVARGDHGLSRATKPLRTQIVGGIKAVIDLGGAALHTGRSQRERMAAQLACVVDLLALSDPDQVSRAPRIGNYPLQPALVGSTSTGVRAERQGRCITRSPAPPNPLFAALPPRLGRRRLPLRFPARSATSRSPRWPCPPPNRARPTIAGCVGGTSST